MRRAALAGAGNVVAAPSAAFVRLSSLAGLGLAPERDGATGAQFVASPGLEDGRVLAPEAALALARACGDGLLVVDESMIEFSSAPSLALVASRSDNLVVMRDLATAFGVAGDPCGALIAAPERIRAFEEVLEPEAVSASTTAALLTALDPARMASHEHRFAQLNAAKARVLSALSGCASVAQAHAGEGPFVFVTPRDADAARGALSRYGATGVWRDAECFRLTIAEGGANERALAAFGAPALSERRRAEVVRETAETRIAACVDLDVEGGSLIDTGIGFFDHMLAQVAAHGGFQLTLACSGDLEVDAHHTIEDCALTLGQALKEALGARRGIARYGFVLPMDEAEAKVSIDLGGRAYLVFEATFSAPLLGAYPTEMTEHVFRSLAQSMGAAIHVAVTGGNDHHKTEACFKAFGRALRQGVRIESALTPSTKGVIA